jgi:nucleoside recognition membrane protein YjiH
MAIFHQNMAKFFPDATDFKNRKTGYFSGRFLGFSNSFGSVFRFGFLASVRSVNRKPNRNCATLIYYYSFIYLSGIAIEAACD